MLAELTARQLRELQYHEQRAEQHRAELAEPVGLSIVRSDEWRWWNAYWETYRLLRLSGLRGKRVLVLGCGSGQDVIRLAAMGAEAYGCDLSPDLIGIARDRAKRAGVAAEFDVMPAERLTYPVSFFDAVLFVDILHHVDIYSAMIDVRRVLKPGALVIGDELYTHSFLQWFRESGFIARVLYPRMVRWIYGTDKPYITEDEHKIDEREFGTVCHHLAGVQCQYFGFVEGRLLPGSALVAKIDRLAMIALGRLGRFLGGRVVFSGRLAK